MFGVLWIVPAVGFILAAVAMVSGWSWWQPLLIGVTLFLLMLTLLDWRVAYAGVVVNLVILAVLTLEPHLVNWSAR